MIFKPENLERGTWPAEKQISRARAACSIFVLMLLTLGSTKTVTAQNDVMGELQFEGKTKVERDSGVWIDGNYVGYLKELNGSKKISATVPEVTATLKLKIKPERAAVFLDGKFVGHAGDFGGAFKSMKISPGKHRVRVELPAYRTFETEVNLLANQESEIKTELVKGSIEQNTPLIKKPDDKPQQKPEQK